LKPWFERHDDQLPQLVNMYGITETTVHVTYRPITIADLEQSSGSVIGVPLPDLQLYILDQHLQPVPIGVPGEIFVGGAGLAVGYLNRPELTAERFIPDPFSKERDAKLYKSGDLARYLSTRDIEYLGRIDHQVKIRGFRIELGEIETNLRQYPGVQNVVVLVREDIPGDKRLVAYVVANVEFSPTTNELREHLGQRLPGYMLPSVFVKLDVLPLTPNGKVDRRALPAPDQAQIEMGNEYVPPQTPTEEVLAGIWANILQVDRVGIHDNFFELGGHSLFATQVVSRIRDSFQINLPLHSIFEAPTIAEISEVVERVLNENIESLTTEITPALRKMPRISRPVRGLK